MSSDVSAAFFQLRLCCQGSSPCLCDEQLTSKEIRCACDLLHRRLCIKRGLLLNVRVQPSFNVLDTSFKSHQLLKGFNQLARPVRLLLAFGCVLPQSAALLPKHRQAMARILASQHQFRCRQGASTAEISTSSLLASTGEALWAIRGDALQSLQPAESKTDIVHRHLIVTRDQVRETHWRNHT